jgi:hypothetical protein
MDFETVVVFALLAFMAWLYVRAAPRLWTGHAGPAADERPPAWWPLGAPSWRGGSRAALVTVPSGALLILFGWGFNRTTPGSTAYGVLGTLAAASTLLLIGLTVTITLVNRPRFLVPPHLRAQRGVLQERRERRRRNLRG